MVSKDVIGFVLAGLIATSLSGGATGQGAAPQSSAPGTVPAGAPAWLAGCWEQRVDEAWSEECWTVPRGGMVMGSGRSGKARVVNSWEAMQIIPDKDGTLVFWASPMGSPRVPFRLESRTESELVFVNAGNDYPQRVRYWREGDMLRAEISMADGSKPMRWQFRRMGGG